MYFKRTGVELLREEIAEIVADRQELRTSGASRASLEENRRRLVRRQSELARELIAQYAPHAPAA